MLFAATSCYVRGFMIVPVVHPVSTEVHHCWLISGVIRYISLQPYFMWVCLLLQFIIPYIFTLPVFLFGGYHTPLLPPTPLPIPPPHSCVLFNSCLYLTFCDLGIIRHPVLGSAFPPLFQVALFFATGFPKGTRSMWSGFPPGGRPWINSPKAIYTSRSSLPVVTQAPRVEHTSF